MAAVTVHSDGAQVNKTWHCLHFPPYICHELIRLNAMLMVFLMLSFKPAFSLFSFILIKKLFSSFLLPAIKVVLSAYLMLLIVLLAILIPACGLLDMAFHTMYSAYKLNKHGDNI